MEPLRSDTSPPAETLTGTERDARIEQLLLAGLDEYFAGQYEQAINLWTRVLFLDRHHDRARAYIERARSAQAELQRESEAVLHQGIEAFHEGDVVRARQLVADALDRGASRDDAQGMLDRIERLGAGRTAPALGRRAMPPLQNPEPQAVPASARPKRVRGWAAALLLIAAAVGVLAVGFLGFTLPEPTTWPIFSGTPANAARAVQSVAPEPLPVASANERFLRRGRSLFVTGRLRDALNEVDRIPIGDPLRADADELRSDIQRELLALAAAERPAASSADQWPVRRPPE